MPPRLSMPRKGWAVLAAGAVVASLLAAGATTATATTDTPDEKSPVTACLGEALTDWGFTDVSAQVRIRVRGRRANAPVRVFRSARAQLREYSVTRPSLPGR